MKVAANVKGGLDQSGNTILTVYYRNPPHYAIYRTSDRVMIDFHDDPEEQARQRRQLAPISPLKGQIDGLIDGWRGLSSASQENADAANRGLTASLYHWFSGGRGSKERRAAAAAYDRRVADALSLALEDDVPSAILYLEGVKRDIEADRNARARRFYVSTAVLFAFAFVAATWTNLGWQNYSAQVDSLKLAGGAGALGAFFSVAIATRNRAPLTDLRLWDNGIDAALRIVIGMIGAVVLIALFRTGMVTSAVFGEKAAYLDPTHKEYKAMLVATIGFLAGFVERLVGDLLSRVVINTDPPKVAAPIGPAPEQKSGAGAGGAAAAAAGAAASAALPADAHDEDGGEGLCDIEPEPGEITPDDALPAASGGVEIPGQGREP